MLKCNIVVGLHESVVSPLFCNKFYFFSQNAKILLANSEKQRIVYIENEVLQVKRIFVGGRFNCVVFVNDLRLKGWGANFSGELGSGDTNNRGEDKEDMGENHPFVDLGEDDNTLAHLAA